MSNCDKLHLLFNVDIIKELELHFCHLPSIAI